MNCNNKPRYVIAFYDMSKGPKMGPPEAYGEPVGRVSLCEEHSGVYKAAAKQKGLMPHHLPARKGVGCGEDV